jgi:hypothetical protein
MARKGKISELYDLDKIQQQQDKVIGLVNEFIDKVGTAKPIAVNLEGAEKTKEVVDGIKNINSETQSMVKITNLAINEMGKLTTMSKTYTGSLADQKTILDKVNGSFEQNIQLQLRYKARLEELKKTQKELTDAYNQGQVSADEYTNKIIDLNAEQKQLQEANKSLSTTLRNQAKELNSAEGSLEQLQTRLTQLQQVYASLSEDDPLRGFIKGEIDQLLPKVKQLEQGIGQFGRNVGNYSGAIKILEGALNDVKTKIDQMNQSGQANETVLQQLQKEYALLEQVVSNQANGFVSMRQEIQANEIAIETLIKQYGEDDATVQKLIKTNAKLRDSFNDLKATQKALGSDTFAFDAILQGGQALVGMYSAAQGAAALFGDENEDLQKTFVKLQAAMALVQGVQAVVNALQKESALVQGLLAVRTAVTTAAMRVYTFVTGGATAAAKAFNATLIASGIGIVLLLISQAASAMSSFGDNTKDATNDLQNFNEELEFTNQLLDDVNASFDFDTKIAIEKLKQRGAAQEEITKKEIEGVRRRIENNKLEIQANADKLKTISGHDEKAQEAKQKLVDRGVKLQKENIKLEGDIILKGEQEKTKVIEDARNKQKQLSDKAAEEAKKRAEDEAKAAFELQKYYAQKQIDYQNATAENQYLPYKVRVQALMTALEGEEKLIVAQKDFELSHEKLTQSQRQLIIQKSEDKILDIRAEAAMKMLQFRKDDQDALQKLQDDTDAFYRNEAQKEINRLTVTLDDQLDVIQRSANAQIAIELDRYSKGEVNKEQYEQRKLEIENKARKESLLAEIAYYESLIKISNLPADKEADALKRLSELRKELNDLDVKNTEDANAKKAESDKQYHDQLKQRLEELGEALKETVFTVLTAGIERQKNQIQDQIDLIEQRKEKEIDAANQTITNEQEKAAKIAVINAKADAQKAQLDRRRRQLDEQKARFDRAKAVVDIIQSTAVAIIKTLADFPGPQGLVLSAIIGALGAAQLATTLAQPIPKYAMGTDDHPGGFAEVGDGGKREYVQTPDGRIYETPNRSTFVDLPAHSKVFKDRDALESAMVNQAIRVLALTDMSKSRDNGAYLLSKDIKDLKTGVVKAIQNIPQPNIVVENPLRRFVKHGHGSIETL